MTTTLDPLIGTPAMNTVLDPLVSEFETAEEEASHTAWLRAKIAESIADPRPRIPHDEVMRHLDERLAYWQDWHDRKNQATADA